MCLQVSIGRAVVLRSRGESWFYGIVRVAVMALACRCGSASAAPHVPPAVERPVATAANVLRLVRQEPALPDPTAAPTSPTPPSASAPTSPPSAPARPPSPPVPLPPVSEEEIPAASLPVMTLDELQALALAGNPSLVRMAAEVRAAQGNWLQVGLYPNPELGYSANQMNDRGTAGQQGMYAAQTFVLGGKRRLNRASAAWDVRSAQHRLSAQRFRVLSDVRLRYFDALVAQRSLELSERLLAISEQGVVTAEALLRAQEASRVDLLQARIERDTARILVVRSQNRLQAAWRGLAAVVGIAPLEARPLAGDLQAQWPEYRWPEVMARLELVSPELAAARSQIQRAGWALTRARVEPIPNLNTQFYPQYDTNARFANYSVQMSMSVPLFDRNQGNIRRAQGELMGARAELSRVQLALQQRAALIFERYANARAQAERYQRDITPAAQETLDLVTQGYRQGEFPYLTLLTAQRTYFNVNVAYLDALGELWQSSVVLDGLLLSDSLQTEP